MTPDNVERSDAGRPERVYDKYRKMVSVLAAHRIALWEYDIATGACDFDDEYFRILGLGEAGIVFSDIDDFYRVVHPDDEAKYRNAFARVLISSDENVHIRVRCIGTGGQIVWLEDNFYAYRKDERGNPQKLIAYTANITAQCEKEERIRRLEERNRKVVEALPEFIFIFDERFFITDVLMSEDTVLLHDRGELVGADGRTIYSPEVSDLFVRNIRQCLQDGRIHEIEYPLDNKGRRYYFQARIAPFESGKVMALIHDVGERVRRDKELIEAKRKAEEADRMKSLFLATMSHEIRTPLNAIVGFSEMLVADECSGQERDEYLGIIRKNSSLLLQLIDDILDLSRIESGRTETRFEQVPLLELLDEVEKIHRMRLTGEVKLETEYPEEEVVFMTDRNRLTQVLFNFMSNAIKNTERGSITLGARVGEQWVELFVRDTGVGIPESRISQIFDHFEKLNDAVQGTGLGLSICRSIAERLGGQIDVKSREGRGSTFSIRLPCRPSHLSEVAEAPEAAGQEGGGATDGRKVILVAEDLEVNFKLLNALLRQEYELRWVPNGREAVDSFVRERPDLILMDIKMPVMNGIEAAERIRAISPEVPIIAVTAHAFYSEQQQAMAAGCNAIVSKPYSAEDLKKTIKKWLSPLDER